MHRTREFVILVLLAVFISIAPCLSLASAQGIITTVTEGRPPDGATATSVGILRTTGVASDGVNFLLCGVGGFPLTARAQLISDRLIAIATDAALHETIAGAEPQIVNPADNAAPDQSANAPAGSQQPERHLLSFEMPPIEVYGKAPLDEEDRIGDYAQPRWTAHRRFGETRVYVIPKGMVDFEYWLIPKTSRDGSTDTASQYEVEFGLPRRFQLDLYAVSHKTGISGPLAFSEQKAELRWAFADWGKITGNPTIYVEWKGKDSAPDHFEGKLLLGGQIVSGWHWGSNFVWEHELGGPQENSNEWTTGISYTVRDSKLSAGVETQVALVNSLDAAGRRGAFGKEFLIGPSLQFRPLPQMHIDCAPLFGTTHAAARSKVFVVVGYEF